MFLLIGAAAFAFVLRATEFLVVQDRVYEIAETYQTVGFLQPTGDAFSNVLDGAEVIAGSRYVDFEDRRRGFEGVLHGMQNAATQGRISGGAVRSGLEASVTEVPERNTYSFFYGTVDRIQTFSNPFIGHHMQLDILVDDIIVAYPEHIHLYNTFAEHVISGQRLQWENIEVRLVYYFADGGLHALDDIEIGERYLFRSTHYWVDPYGRGVKTHTPRIGTPFDIMYIQPLSDDGLWFVPAPDGPVDFTLPGLAHLPAEIEQQKYNHSVVSLRTTKDMEAMPIFDEDIQRASSVRGRLLTHEDYLEARPVAVIHETLAQYRGIDIGDTITVSVPREQRIVDLHTAMYFGERPIGTRAQTFVFADGMLDFAVLGTPGDYVIEELELEVVGTYFKLPNSPETTSSITNIFWNSYTGILFSGFVYIPDSLIPAGFYASDEIRGYDEYLWDVWYSFTLNSSRHEAAFLHQYRNTLSDMGLLLQIVPSGADNFWESAEPILLSIYVNASMFSIVLVMVLGLVTFLYLNQRRRDFAILRAIGMPRKKAVRQMLAPMLIFGLPAMITGGLFGWFFAIDTATSVLAPIGEALEMDIYLHFPVYWLVLQLAIVLLIMCGMLFFGAKMAARKPVLELLQGNSSAAKTYAQTAMQPAGQSTLQPTDETTGSAQFSGNTHTFINTKPNLINIIKATCGFILRHILRAPLKSTLTVAMALFFITALGMLSNTIVNTEREIDRMYDTTIVSGELLHSLAGTGSVIQRVTADTLLAQDFILSHYAEAGWTNNFIILPDPDGNFPTEVEGYSWPVGTGFWDDFWYYMRQEHLGQIANRGNPIYSFSDIDVFLANAADFSAVTAGGLNPGLLDGMTVDVVTGPLVVEFADGFGWDDFVYTDADIRTAIPIPVILPVRALAQRGLELGDHAFVGWNFADVWSAGWDDFEAPIVVIGHHNGSFNTIDAINTILMPFDAFASIRGERLTFMSLEFEIDPAYNREIRHVADQIGAISSTFRQNQFGTLTVLMHDAELRNTINNLEQNLNLLQLLYPVAIGLSIGIGAGMALLIMIQSAKIAAIMRVLGFGRRRTGTTLCAEHIIVAAFGVVIGLGLLPLFGFGFNAEMPLLSVLYMVGVVCGSVFGAIIITKRAPLELLQVRE